MGRKPFSLTYVTYEEGDRVGLLCALLAMAPVFIIVSYATLLVSRREAHLAYILVGQLLNRALNDVLKSHFNQPRPAGCDHDGPGFPSDHSQFMGFWACYGALFLATRVPRVGRAGWRAGLMCGTCGLALAVAWSRVYLGYHSTDQVCAGLAVGAAVGAAWYAAYDRLLRHRLRGWVTTSRLCRYFLVRDSAHVEDVIYAEYACVMGGGDAKAR